MIFNMKLLLAIVFLLIAIVQGVSIYSHSRHSKRHHQDRHHRSIVDNDVGYQTSCGESLCSTMNTYPTRKIHGAWKHFDRLTKSDKSVFQRVLVDSGYLHQQYQPIDHGSNESFILNHYNCKTEEFKIFPVEGKSSDDNELYYIINLPEVHQIVDKKICKLCEPNDTLAFCQQRFEYRKLLVIPVRKNSFTAEDVTVKTFEVPYSCDCSSE